MNHLSALADVIRDPARFARGVLEHDPWWLAEEIMRSVLTEPRTVVRSCHASSKTFTAAEIATWWPIRFRDGRVVTTAPTDTQVKELLWKEIGLNVETLRRKFSGIPPANQKSWRLAAGRDAVGLSTNQGVRFQGWHGDHILIILDEAAGVRPDIYPAIEGIRAGGGVHVLAIGNPSSPSGPFYDAFTKDRALWKGFVINALRTPNFVDELYTGPGRRFIGDLPDGAEQHEGKCRHCSREVLVRPDGCCSDCATIEALLELRDSDRLLHGVRKYLVSRQWVLEKYDEWGIGSPLWDTKVLGNFPSEGADQLLGLAFLEAAENRVVPAEEDPLEVGIDVAGPGEDETVLTVRRGRSIETIQGWAMPDPRGQCLATMAPWKEELQARGLVKIDSVGQGYYFAKHIQDQGYGDRVRFVNVGAETRMPEKYTNLKAELYWGLRMRVRAGDLSLLRAKASGVSDATIQKTISQLASIKYKHNERGQIQIEKKEDAVKRGVKSPDYAESVMLAFATDNAPALVQFYGSQVAPRDTDDEGDDDDDE